MAAGAPNWWKTAYFTGVPTVAPFPDGDTKKLFLRVPVSTNRGFAVRALPSLPFFLRFRAVLAFETPVESGVHPPWNILPSRLNSSCVSAITCVAADAASAGLFVFTAYQFLTNSEC